MSVYFPRTLTFVEWYDWLSRDVSKVSTASAADPGYTSSHSGYVESTATTALAPALLSALKHVLGFATSTLSVAARASTEPAHVLAAFVAGALATGHIAQQLVEALVSRLTPEVR